MAYNKNIHRFMIKLRTWSWIFAPIIFAIFGIIMNYLKWIDLADASIRSSIITSSGLLAGFLFASFSLLTAMPAVIELVITKQVACYIITDQEIRLWRE